MSVYEDIYNEHGFSQTQKKIIQIVGNGKTILEIGASSGYMTKAFLNNGCTVDVIEEDKLAAKKIPKGIRKLINASVEENGIKKKLNKNYDYIILADVIEHLVDGERILKILKNIANLSTILLISTPNIACWAIRKQLFIEGKFEYQESGILDKTHVHLYTTLTLPETVQKCGWKVEDLIGVITRMPFENLIKKLPVINLIFINFIKLQLVKIYPNLLIEHFILIARR